MVLNLDLAIDLDLDPDLDHDLGRGPGVGHSYHNGTNKELHKFHILIDCGSPLLKLAKREL